MNPSTSSFDTNGLRFLGDSPGVKLVGSFDLPYDSAVAAARTCYSPRGIVTPQEVAGTGQTDPAKVEALRAKRDALAHDLLQAGHHTVFQHAHFQFALSGVSRHLTWGFLHAHPFYNSEQVSQRYVTVKGSSCVVPDIGPWTGKLNELFEAQFEAYRLLCQMLFPVAQEAFFDRFPARKRDPAKWEAAIKKKAQEVARYVLPIATTTYLYHTVSGLTLMRYLRAARAGDLPSEQERLVRAMVAEMIHVEPGYANILQEPLPESAFVQESARAEDAAGFDAQLDGKISKLVAFSPADERTLAATAQWNLSGRSGDGKVEESIEGLLSPARNRILGQNLNLTFHDRYSRVMHHAHYTFAKKLSHTADSQDQRHRLTPASRPPFRAHRASSADYVTPILMAHAPAAKELYDSIVSRSWETAAALLGAGVPDEAVQYAMPNAATLRFYESGDLMGFRHKMEMRLCYNAQEEIWQAAVEEADQIEAVHPTVGKFLLPPCSARDLAGVRPICPEGSRFCGVRVWDLPRSQYTRVL